MLWRICVRCLPVRTAGNVISCGVPHHQSGATAIGDFLVVLIEAAMLEGHDTLGRAGLALAHGQNFRLRPYGITGKDRAWKFGVFHAEISDRRPERGVLY